MNATRDDLACRELVELVTDYLEDALDGATRTRFESHLAECPGCTVYLDQMRTTIGVLGALPLESLRAEAWERLLEAFQGWRRTAAAPE
jgi:anti-sigma factor RsiW